MITVTVGLDPTVAGHFLLRDLGLICALASEAGTRPLPVTRTAGGFEIAIADPIAGWIDLRFEVRFQHDGKGWVLHKIRQVLVIPPSRQPGLMPVRWYKGASLTSVGVPVNTPPLHPHLTVRGLAITVGSRFLDITDWFMSIHGATPWFRTLEIVRTTEFSLRVLAYLGGRPLIWYVVVPASARDAATVAPHVSYWAADFGGIDYPHDTVAGITSRNHSVSVSSPTQAVQCGGNVLCSYLLTPLTHEEYVRKAPTWAAAQARFEDSRRGPHDLMPPELHLMLPTLGLKAHSTSLWTETWSMPFGLERTIAGTDRVLVFPQIHGGDAGWAVAGGLRERVGAALVTIACQTAVFSNAIVGAKPLILSGYSQAGGNLFTASDANLGGVRAIVAVETQYMNDYLKGENMASVLGRIAIPKLLRAGVKVVVIARRREGWQQAKYLPRGVPAASLTLLPSERQLGVVSYPPDPAHPFWRHRLGRLLDPGHHETRVWNLGPGSGVMPPRISGMEMLVDSRIDDMRRQGFTDTQLITTMFTAWLNSDRDGGAFTHNFLMSGGEDPAPFEPNGKLKPNQRPKTFVQQALELIG